MVGRRSVTQRVVSANGTVQEVLPGGLYQILLDDGRRVCASLGRTERHGMVRVISGDRVAVRLSANDPQRGQVTAKL